MRPPGTTLRGGALPCLPPRARKHTHADVARAASHKVQLGGGVMRGADESAKAIVQ